MLLFWLGRNCFGCKKKLQSSEFLAFYESAKKLYLEEGTGDMRAGILSVRLLVP